MNEYYKVGLSYKEVASKYHVHINTVRQWVQKNWLRTTRFGGRVYFTADQLKEFEERGNK